MGFRDGNECPQLCKLAYDYLRKVKGCEDRIYEYFANEAEADSLYIKLIEEFDKCILSYFAFHWGQASLLINQVYIYIYIYYCKFQLVQTSFFVKKKKNVFSYFNCANSWHMTLSNES